MPPSTCSSRWKRTAIASQLLELFLKLGRMRSLHLLHQLLFLRHVLQNGIPVIPEVSQCGINVRKRDLWKSADNFIRRLSLQLMPCINILNPYAMSGNAGPAATNSWCAGDVLPAGWRMSRAHLALIIAITVSTH